MKIDFLQANHGDSVLVSYQSNGENRNILIDGGSSATYSSRSGRHIRYGSLKKSIEAIKDKNEKIDLLVLTHVDDDHIAGILKWFESYEFSADLINKVWFNAGKLINKQFQKNLENDNNIELAIYNSSNTSIGQGITFEERITEHNLWYEKIIKAGDVFEELGAKFTILSPSEDELKKLLIKWEKEAPDTLTSGRENDYIKTLEELMSTDEFKEDASIHNGSSIAFLLEIEDKKILLLADAFPSVVSQSLESLGYSIENPLKVDIVKLSHHGSKGNTGNELLDLIDCEKFVISTNGAKHALPNKRTLARIIKKKPCCKFYFNYPELIEQIFTEEEIENRNFYVFDSKDINV